MKATMDDCEGCDDFDGNECTAKKCRLKKPNPVTRFLLAIPRVIYSAVAYALHPKHLKLTVAQAEYVQELFLGGAMPEAVGRAMHTMFNRRTWKYFQVFNAETFRFEWPQANDDGQNRVDFEIDGLEYINAAIWALGGVVKGCYDPNHPMVKMVAVHAGQQREETKKKGAK